MSIHHRTYTRIPLALEVHLQFKGENLGHAFTRNINSFGAFIELPKPELATNDFIKIYFWHKDGTPSCVVQKGMVMHRNKEGVGVIFATDTEEFRNMLLQEMTQAGLIAMAIRLGLAN
ncbi:MAG: hypothetical protein ACI8XG_001825 [Congregibacter sp.]